MPIANRSGNLLTLTSGILVHGCNCQGKMGSGLAKSIRDTWPDVYTAYVRHQAHVGLRLGDVNFVASTSFAGTPVASHAHMLSKQLPPGVIVANAMTQRFYGRDPSIVYVSYDAISEAFARIGDVARLAGLPVHFPLIGCGLANGKWGEVAPRIESALDGVESTLWTQ